MTSSLVGSEMCIRDRALVPRRPLQVELYIQVYYDADWSTDLLDRKSCLLYTSDAADDSSV
eukprot:6343179-Prorocentrum_lima.AAC.1